MVARAARGPRQAALLLALAALLAWPDSDAPRRWHAPLIQGALADVGFSLDIATCISSASTANSFFDSRGMECAPCPSGAARSSNGLFCACSGAASFSIQPNLSTASGLLAPVCTPCPSGSAPSQLSAPAFRCVVCDTSSGNWWNPATVVPDGSSCVCANGGGQVVETDATGVPLLVSGQYLARCVPCSASNSILSNGSCVPCEYPKVASGGACVCPATVPAGATCYNNSDLATVVSELGVGRTDSSAFQVTFYNVPTSSGSTSDATVVVSKAFSDSLGQSARLCWERADVKACNALANACVLQDFDFTRGVACLLYQRIFNSRGSDSYHADSNFNFTWPLYTPWIAYSSLQTAAALRNTDVQLRLSLGSQGKNAQVPTGSPTSVLRFKLASWSLDGTWLGLADLTDQLQLCSSGTAQAIGWTTVGIGYKLSCRLPIDALLQLASDRGGVTFYEMYIEDGTGRLYPVPVVNHSQRDNGALVNGANVTYDNQDLTTASLTRRFFTIDASSGVDATGTLQALRYISKARITVAIRPDDHSRILPPVLELTYASRSPIATGVSSPSSFTARWAGTQGFWRAFRIMVIVFTSVIGALALLRFFLRVNRRRASVPLSFLSLIKAMARICDAVADALFVVVVITGVYWLIVFKLQQATFQLLPSDHEARPFLAAVIAAAAGKSFAMMGLLIDQSQYGISFVDWERPRKILVPGSAKEGLAPTSCWRTLLIANEWSELASSRYSSPEATLVVIIVAMEGFKWQYESASTPLEKDLSSAPWKVDSILIRAGLIVLVFYASVIAQFLIRLSVYDRFVSNPPGAFVDLCYMANLSVFMFESAESAEFGYYIHGRSSITSADTSLQELQDQLHKEAGAVVGGRGLIGDTADDKTKDCQTFEVYLDIASATKYAELVMLGNLSMERQGRDSQSCAGLPTAAVGLSPSEAQRQISYLLRRVVSDVTNNNRADRVVRKNFLDYLLRLPPALRLGNQSPLFVYDFRDSFMDLTFYGCDMTLCVWECMILVALDVSLRRPALSAAIVWIVTSVLRLVRAKLGQARLSKAALIDDRFLI